MNFYNFLPKLLNMSLTGAVAIVCVLLLRLLLKKAPKVISYAMWAVVMVAVIVCGILSIALLTNPAKEDTPDRSEDGDYLLIGEEGVTEAAADDEIEENQPVAAKWTFSPMMSATWHAAFHFNFEMDNYSHIEATCDNGMLWNPRAQGQPKEKTMRFEQGEPLCWMPMVEGETLSDTAEKAAVTFTVYDGEEIVDRGVLDIVKIGDENGQSFYEALLRDTAILALWQEEGSLEASIVIAGNGTIVSYSDLNHNRINERIVVREVYADMLYELLVVEDGIVIWSVEAGLPHVGWNTIMHYEEDGKSYLVEYHPTMYQGIGAYQCKMYSLENGKEIIKQEWAVDFELSTEETFDMEPTPEMEQFAREVGILLRNSSVLLSTEQGILVRQFADASSLPQIYPIRFEPDEIWAAINGTCYVSMFEGRFTDIWQISDYAWSMKLENLTTEKEPEETWIEDGVRYIASEAYGVVGGEEYILYAPGTPADELPAECRNWWPDAYQWRAGEIEQLEGWGLCNLDTGQGFFTDWMD